MDSDRGKIFVGGIPWETTEEKLKDYFNGFGPVSEAVIMKDKATGRARGFGFVVFADPSVIDKVLTDKHTIDGRMVDVKKAVPRDEQQNLSRSNSGDPVSGNLNRTKKIFVGGLASTVNEDDFRNYFSQFGNITDVVVMYDPSTRRPRGFGFITFDSEDAVEKVIQQKTFHEIHEKTVEVKKAVPRELSASRTGGAAFGSGRGTMHIGGYGFGSNASAGGPRFAAPSAGRGAYSSYGLASYGTPGYGGAPGYSVPTNGVYGAASYGGGPGYPPSGVYGASGYGSAPTMNGYGSVAGYGAPMNVPVPGPRSPWGGSGAGYVGAASPAAYGTGGAGGMGGYGAPGWNAGGAPPQVNGGMTGYNNPGYGYGYGTNAEAHNYASGASAVGYGVVGRQAQRGPDIRFRPYPPTGERVA